MGMTSRVSDNNMPATPIEAQWPALRRAARTVVVVDMVESVRLIEQDEEGTVRRWQAFVGEVVSRLLPQHGVRGGASCHPVCHRHAERNCPSE
jgi:hypothetical protein